MREEDPPREESKETQIVCGEGEGSRGRKAAEENQTLSYPNRKSAGTV